MMAESLKPENESDGEDSCDSVEYPEDDQTSQYERKILRLKRRRERAFLSAFEDGEIQKLSQLSQFLPAPVKPSQPSKPSKPSKQFRPAVTPKIALERRKSLRTNGQSVDYQLTDDFVEPSKYRRKSYGGSRKKNNREVDYDAESRPGKIEYSCIKLYSKAGTTCHQCRQKTIDLKSYCYSSSCTGVRGQFCGYCLFQRYGEDVAVTLKDKSWTCPPCRGICNCSICRRNHGKMPTGQLYRCATSKGFQNVNDYLATLGDQMLTYDETITKRSRESELDEESSPKKIKLEEEATGMHLKEEPIDEGYLESSDIFSPEWQPVVKLERLDVFC